MSDCQKFEPLMEKMIAGEPIEDRGDLLRHVEECPACRDLLDFHEWLATSAPGFDEPDAADLAGMRRAVLARISAAEAAPARTPALRPPLWAAWARPGLAAAASAAVFVAAGFLAGWLARPAAPAGARDGIEPGLVDPAGALDFTSSPYLLSNVTVEPLGSDHVRLGFDVTRRVEIEKPAEDPIVREALVQALLGSAPLANRLEAVTLVGGMRSADVKAALVRAMESDPSVAVRLRALSTLVKNGAEPETQEAILRVLKNEPNVQMRLLAIDYLGSARVDAGRIREALAATQADGAQAVLNRASEKLGI